MLFASKAQAENADYTAPTPTTSQVELVNIGAVPLESPDLPLQAPEKAKVDIPYILQKIAQCESGNRQFNNEGEVFRGWYNQQDVGRFQINLYYHEKEAKRLGMDVMTLKGNTDYALYLYKTQGTNPWIWSKSCWDK